MKKKSHGIETAIILVGVVIAACILVATMTGTLSQTNGIILLVVVVGITFLVVYLRNYRNSAYGGSFSRNYPGPKQENTNKDTNKR